MATREIKKNCSFLLAKFKTRNHVQTFLQVKHYQQLAGRREDELGLLRGEVGFLFYYLLLLGPVPPGGGPRIVGPGCICNKQKRYPRGVTTDLLDV